MSSLQVIFQNLKHLVYWSGPKIAEVGIFYAHWRLNRSALPLQFEAEGGGKRKNAPSFESNFFLYATMASSGSLATDRQLNHFPQSCRLPAPAALDINAGP